MEVGRRRREERREAGRGREKGSDARREEVGGDEVGREEQKGRRERYICRKRKMGGRARVVRVGGGKGTEW